MKRGVLDGWTVLAFIVPSVDFSFDVLSSRDMYVVCWLYKHVSLVCGQSGSLTLR